MTRQRRAVRWMGFVAALLSACGDDDAPRTDAGDAGLDAEATDAGVDAGPAEDAGMADDAGADGGIRMTYFKASNTNTADNGGQFGWSVSLSADGSRLAVGARSESSSATGINGDQFAGEVSGGGSGAVYVFVLAGTTWTQEAYIKASNTGNADLFGASVSLSADGTQLAVGAPQESSSATGVGGDQTDDSMYYSGAVYLFTRTGTEWAQEAYMKASNTAAFDQFGISVSLSADGTRLAVGAVYEDSAATGIGGDEGSDLALDSGAAYVFARGAGGWAQEAYLKASNTRTNDRFGGSVSLSGDGARLAVGAAMEDSNATGVGADALDDSAADSGAVYVFSRAGLVWTQEAYVKASNTDPLDQFGSSVSLSADGNTLAISAPGEASAARGVNGNQSDDSLEFAGAAYVFSHSTTWAQQAYLKTSMPGLGFGAALSLSADGGALVVGVPNEDRGAAYVFGRSALTWTSRTRVTVSNELVLADYCFGCAVSLSQDGARFAVGAWGEPSRATGIDGDPVNADAPEAGAVFLYF